jgi:hypothetical protein
MLDGSEAQAQSRQADIIAFERHFNMPFVKATLDTIEIEGKHQPAMRMEHMWFLAYSAWRRDERKAGREVPDFDTWVDDVDEVDMVQVEDFDPKA